MIARCVCGQPVAFNVRRSYSWGVGPWESVCPDCAPAPVECAKDHYLPFYGTADEAVKVRAESEARRLGSAA